MNVEKSGKLTTLFGQFNMCNLVLMGSKVLHIKNMVCPRCIKVVNEELISLGLDVKHVELGIAEYENTKDISESQIEALLNKEGFEILKTNEEEIIERIKHLIITTVRESSVNNSFNYSQHLSDQLHKGGSIN